MRSLFTCAGLIVLTIAFVLPAAAQQQSNVVQKTDPLYQKVAELDSAMFSAYNKRNLEGLMSFFSSDLNFMTTGAV